MHTNTHTPTLYLEIWCLGLVYCEPHKNSELQVIGERLSVNAQKEKDFQSPQKHVKNKYNCL